MHRFLSGYDTCYMSVQMTQRYEECCLQTINSSRVSVSQINWTSFWRLMHLCHAKESECTGLLYCIRLIIGWKWMFVCMIGLYRTVMLNFEIFRFILNKIGMFMIFSASLPIFKELTVSIITLIPILNPSNEILW